MLNKLNLDLGLSRLLPEWKQLLSPRNLLSDINAGVTVACIAIPLSLAIALASGVSPGVGLITAIIAGIVCALFGGTPLAVSGPAAAMSILIATSVEKFGVNGLVFMCLMIGIMQVISGVFRLGRFSRYVPLPVIAAFTSGIGVIIIIGQLPRIFGLPQPDQAHIFGVLTHLAQYFHHIKPEAFFIVLLTIAIIRILPLIFPRLPSALIAVAVATYAVQFFQFTDVPLIGTIPNSLPSPTLPGVPNAAIGELFLSTFTIYILACLETLLSSSAVDKLVKTEKHDPNQELVGQGLGNVLVSLFGGIPVTGVIARSAVNVKSGAKTRRASIIHSIVLLLAVYVAGPLISKIPIAALAGVLLSVAVSMINYKEFRNLWDTSRGESWIYLLTFFTIIFVDLIAGIQVGVLAAGLIILIPATRTNLHVSTHTSDVVRLSFTGALTFLSTSKISEIEISLQNVRTDQIIILELSKIMSLDSSGATALIELINNFLNRDFKIYVKGLPSRYESLFKMCEGKEILEKCYLVTESELKRNKDLSLNIKSFRERLIHGVQKFYVDRADNHLRLYDHIVAAQDPHTLFITCSDSRILTSSITSSDPGELFIIRNVGNFIPPYNINEKHSEAAALEFALTQLDIRDIVICGHSSCGAIKACSDKNISLTAQLSHWIEKIRAQLNLDITDLHELSQHNVLNQIHNIKQYPIVQQKLANETLTIHGWFFDFEKQLVYEWTEPDQMFKAIEDHTPNLDSAPIVGEAAN